MQPCWGAELSGLLAAGCGGGLLRRRRDLDLRMAWRLRVLLVCASTEPLLSHWLAAQPLLPIAVVSKKQRFGRGTAQRHWQSPAGGLWLSAAIPWGGEPPAADRLPLLMAAALMAELEPLGLGAELHLKPPNDLMVGQQKLAGVLTSVVWRGGQVRHVRFGIGLNGRHSIRPPGITLEQLLGSRCPPWPKLVHIGLRALERLALN